MNRYWLMLLLCLLSMMLASCTSAVNISGKETADNSSVESEPIMGFDLSPPSLDPGQQVEESEDTTWVPRASSLDDTIGVHYKGEHEEALTWGPKNFTIDPVDGTLWIADTAGDQILNVDRDGSIIDVLDTSQDAVGAAMAAVNENEIAVISVASQPPRVLRYNFSGELLATYSLPMEWQGSVTGIEITDEGIVTVQREHGYRRHRILEQDDGSVRIVDVSGITWDLNEPSEFDRFVISPVDSRNIISLRRFMGEWDSVTYVYAEEWRDDEYGQAVVDSTVHMFNEKNEEIGIARVNIRDRYTFVDLGGIQHDTESGKMLTMMTRENGLLITALSFVDHLDPLEDWGAPEETEGVEDVSIPVMNSTCISGSTMASNASSMANATWSPPSSYSPITNDSSVCTCSSRTMPGYLPSGGVGPYFSGVPYSWGDWDNASSFSSYMSSSNATNCYKAGDADATYTSPTSCGRGTDCSGLVSNAWGLSGKIGTSSIASSAYATTDTGSWDQGEVYNKSGTHVVLYDGVYSGSTYYWYEATTDSDYDRAVHTTHPTSYWSGYTHRRYLSQC